MINGLDEVVIPTAGELSHLRYGIKYSRQPRDGERNGDLVIYNDWKACK